MAPEACAREVVLAGLARWRAAVDRHAEVSRQLEQDIPIWENKVYLSRPVLCDGDGPIGVFRRWAKQFYSADQLA